MGQVREAEAALPTRRSSPAPVASIGGTARVPSGATTMNLRYLGLATLALLASCASTPDADEHDWLQPSANLRKQIEDQVTRLPWTHGIERIEQIAWFASVGEPAYPYLLELCSDPRPDVAACAVAALGATGDSRLVDPLHQVQWTTDTAPAVRYERARAYLRLGDWSQIGVLVDGLESDDSWTRALCLASLKESTRIDLGFEPSGEAPGRAEAVVRWRNWIASRQNEGFLAAAEPATSETPKR